MLKPKVSIIGAGNVGMPAVIDKGGVREILNMQLNNEEVDLLRKSANTIKTMIGECGL